MRLTSAEREVILDVAREVLGDDVKVRLFGLMFPGSSLLKTIRSGLSDLMPLWRVMDVCRIRSAIGLSRA
ncbi:DNA polymerase [Halorhodospira halochloris]|uniref:DNA polymerase n=1 Tax=Halorhodospira halochloris TaxID=1052 RepID=A0A0X8X7D9_HALHR|nr:hypothetical protein [Halorhodospira halochloris]BAU56992.1 DNA polymerase [Halorhodospira halochloris]